MRLLRVAAFATAMAAFVPVPAQSAITQCGIASWYGPGFHGRTTASGERFNQNALTAAHPSLPFGTVVLVRRTDGGGSVRVRINDRGPYAGGRIIDLSHAAAEELGMIEDGIVPVRISIVGGEGNLPGC